MRSLLLISSYLKDNAQQMGRAQSLIENNKIQFSTCFKEKNNIRMFQTKVTRTYTTEVEEDYVLMIKRTKAD